MIVYRHAAVPSLLGNLGKTIPVIGRCELGINLLFPVRLGMVSALFLGAYCVSSDPGWAIRANRIRHIHSSPLVMEQFSPAAPEDSAFSLTACILVSALTHCQVKQTRLTQDLRVG